MPHLEQLPAEIITSLLENACPSIQYRIRTEILGQSSSDPEVTMLQGLILRDPLVQEAICWQGPDGWRSSTFHGVNGIEAGIRLLCEKGVSHGHPIIRIALDALRGEPGMIYRGIGKPGIILDEGGFGGSQMIRAVVFTYTGAEQEPGVKEQIQVALEGLDFIRSVGSIGDVTSEYKGKLIFKPGVQWPGIYHLRLLAYTRQWRTPDNTHLVIEGIKKLVELSPIPSINVRKGSQLIAPASFAMHNFDPVIGEMNGALWMQWFHRMELLSRMGVIPSISKLQKQVVTLDEILKKGNGWFLKRVSSNYFKNWGVYSGLCLEKDWRSPKRRSYDLTYRSYLIKHHIKESA